MKTAIEIVQGVVDTLSGPDWQRGYNLSDARDLQKMKELLTDLRSQIEDCFYRHSRRAAVQEFLKGFDGICLDSCEDRETLAIALINNSQRLFK